MILLRSLSVILPLIFMAAYYVYIERKVLGFTQDRIGPNRVGSHGLLQPVADMIKLFFKEIIIPKNANKYLFIIAPISATVIALINWTVIPIDEGLVIADLNVGILYVLAIGALHTYSIILGSWASNSNYALLSMLRIIAQSISYEIALGITIIGVIMAAGSMNFTEIVLAQHGGIINWYWLPLFPLLIVYWFAAVARTNRLPFDVVEAESELLGGFHVEYSGITFALFFLAEYLNMILFSFLAAIMFFGGWLSPFEGVPIVYQYVHWVLGIFWLLLKAFIFMISFIWFRATFPRFRYDQIMQLGWKFLIPFSLCWIIIESVAIKLDIGIWT